MLLIGPGAAWRDSESSRTGKNRARSIEITGDQPMIPDAPSDSFSQKIAHMTSPERRRWPQTAKVDGNGARARIPFGQPPRPGQAGARSRKIRLVCGYYVEGGR